MVFQLGSLCRASDFHPACSLLSTLLRIYCQSPKTKKTYDIYACIYIFRAHSWACLRPLLQRGFPARHTVLLKRSPFCNHLKHVAFSTPRKRGETTIYKLQCSGVECIRIPLRCGCGMDSVAQLSIQGIRGIMGLGDKMSTLREVADRVSPGLTSPGV